MKKCLNFALSWSLRLLVVFVMLSGSGAASPPASTVSAAEEGEVLFSDSFDDDFEWDVMSVVTGWGRSDYRAYSGDYSAYCAQEGGYPLYNDYMYTIMYRSVDLDGYVDAELDFYMWLETESSYDYLEAGYYDGAWNWDWSTDTDTSGWELGSDHFSTTLTVPATATRVGFRFTSDSSNTYEGAYVDDVLLTGDTGSDTETVLSDGLESGFAWTVEQEEIPVDECRWGQSDYRAYSGDYSAYCAQEGGYPTYCDEMSTIMYRDVDMEGYIFAALDFRLWLETESDCDYLAAGYYDGGWNWVYLTDIDTTDWEHLTIPIPSEATRIGFHFTSDGSNTFEGAYVDDVVLTAYCGEVKSILEEGFEDEFDWTLMKTPASWGRSDYRANSGDHSAYCAQEAEYPYYANDMSTILSRAVDLDGYVDAELDFSMWLETESTCDYLDVGYYDDGWYWDWSTDTDTSGWERGSDHFATTLTIPSTATRIGFRFESDYSSTYEGAYVDDVLLTGDTGSSTETVLSDDFESGFPWTVSSNDYEWGLSDHRAYSPDHSAYCAYPSADWTYANYMNTIMYRTVALDSYVDAELDFYMWLDTESGCDYLDAGFYDGSWHWDWSTSADTSDWELASDHLSATLTIPSTATRVGFRFTSDYSVAYEGAYIDDVLLTGDTGSGTETVLSDDFESGFDWTVETIPLGWGQSEYRVLSGENSAYCAQEGGYPEYWDYMYTVMYREVDLSDCATATLDFYLWLEAESECDYFSAGYYDGYWHWEYLTDVDTAGWEGHSVTLPPSATRIGFRFFSDSGSTYEGAYVDDVALTGYAVSPCGKQLAAGFTGQPRLGIAPLDVRFADESEGEVTSWLWNFGDGTRSTQQNPSHTYLKRGTYSVSLTVSGPDGSDTITKRGYVTVRGGVDRPPEPAKLGVSYLHIDPAQVLPNQEVVVSANMCNSGEERGSRTVSFMVNGETVDSQSVAASGGACQQVVFRTSRAVPGTYQVAVDGMTGQFSVLAPRTVTGSVPAQQQTPISTAGIIAIVAVCIVLILALILLFRRE